MSTCQEIQAHDLCQHAGGNTAIYSVVHYPRKACGEAFGPLGLPPLLHFCRGLDAALQQGAVALTTPKGDRAARLNALVMLGGYMMGKHAWSSERFAATIGADSGAKFVCSWAPTDTEHERIMTVRDVWDGLEVSFRRGWLSPSCMEDDAKLEAAVTRCRLRAVCFDAAWIIPGLLMVASDPTTVVFDPNPATCKRMAPPTVDEAPPAKLIGGAGAEASSACQQDQFRMRADSILSPKSIRSVDTICKEYNENYEDLLPSDPSLVPADYASFLLQSGIGLVVRANYDREEGMPGLSYSDDTFKSFGIEQANIRIVDTNGGLPKPGDVARMIEACHAFLDMSYEERPAVLVHCKGGFGRSVVLAACLAVYRYDLPGSALLGWVRVARPGAITTRRQEVFLKSLKGKRDVMKYAKMPTDSCEQGGTPCAGCSLQ